MLDRTTTFLSADVLGLHPDYYAAMVEALRRLESGSIPHADTAKFPSSMRVRLGLAQPIVAFDMTTWSESNRCGTVCCIGGLVDLIMANRAFNFDMCYAEDATSRQKRMLHDLYYPRVDKLYNLLTPEQGARALRNYLTTGHSNWENIA